MLKALLIDHYDSFTANLAALVRKSGEVHIDVVRHDGAKIEKIPAYDKIIFSPGPGLPSEYPLMFEILDRYKETKSILGVCLGHQAIGQYFGAGLSNYGQVQHGRIKLLKILERENILLKEVPDSSEIGLYHSWYVDRNQFPDCLKITGESEDGTVMSMAHKSYDINSVQFHPESFITICGEKMMNNWLNDKIR